MVPSHVPNITIRVVEIMATIGGIFDLDKDEHELLKPFLIVTL